MKEKIAGKTETILKSRVYKFFFSALSGLCFLLFFFPDVFGGVVRYDRIEPVLAKINLPSLKKEEPKPVLDKGKYDLKMIELANNPPPPPPETKKVKNPETGKEETVVIEKPAPKYLWPAKTVYPNAGALLPFHRIVAYYGNLYSTKMGVLGQYPEAEMLSRLEKEVGKWEEADPNTPVIPALHYIAVVAQGAPGSDGKYRTRMPSQEIDKVLNIAKKINAIVFLDVQVAFSDVQTEVPLLEKYLKMPNVHLGLDPEFSMKSGIRPGKVVGTMDAADVNFAANYLAKLVKENNLPPKILVVHRYTKKMLTNSSQIRPLPEVQIVVHMDGWGEQAKKIGTYKNFIYPEPVQFTGFKIFYKNDLWTPGTTLLTPDTLLKLNPRPSYIQYQ